MSSQAIATSAASDSGRSAALCGSTISCAATPWSGQMRVFRAGRSMCWRRRSSPLLDYMPGVRKGISDLRADVSRSKTMALAKRLRAESYAPRWSCRGPGIGARAVSGRIQRIGFLGEGRLILLNDVRSGERRLERSRPLRRWRAVWRTSAGSSAAAQSGRAGGGLARTASRRCRRRTDRGAAPVRSGGKRWPVGHYAELASALTAENIAVWVLSAPTSARSPTDRGGRRRACATSGTRLRDRFQRSRPPTVMATIQPDARRAAWARRSLFGPGARAVGAAQSIAAVIEPPDEAPCPCGKPECDDVRHRGTTP